jgi:hypothetical protein
VKHRATASSGATLVQAMTAESKAKSASSAGIPQAVRISPEMAIVPLVGSAFDGAVAAGAVVTKVDPTGVLEAGGLAAAHPVATQRGAIERASAIGANEMDLMVTTSGGCIADRLRNRQANAGAAVTAMIGPSTSATCEPTPQSAM